MSKILLDDELCKLDLEKELESKLNDNGLNTIRDLWLLKRTNLKEMGFKDKEINRIIVHLQLCGYDLNKKKYS